MAPALMVAAAVAAAMAAAMEAPAVTVEAAMAAAAVTVEAAMAAAAMAAAAVTVEAAMQAAAAALGPARTLEILIMVAPPRDTIPAPPRGAELEVVSETNPSVTTRTCPGDLGVRGRAPVEKAKLSVESTP